jgi:uncharacterized protein (TIGR03086 family)
VAEPGHPAARHLLACDGFGTVVASVGDGWDRPAPCAGWDARGVLEHVIGFHDVLLLRPMAMKPDRERDDPVARWSVTAAALAGALCGPGSSAVPDLGRLLRALTTEVLVHTWDLARAAGVDPLLDEAQCRLAYEAALGARQALAAAGTFAPAVPVADGAPYADRLVALLGRDPAWSGP